MNSKIMKLLSVLAKEYSLQSVSTKTYPCMIGILGDDGPWHVKTPREVLLLCINQFYNNFHFETGDEASVVHGELADLGYLIWVNNIGNCLPPPSVATPWVGVMWFSVHRAS